MSLPACPYRFGVFEVEPRSGELRKNGIRFKVQDQPFQVLIKLLENAGKIVTREDLRSALWPADTFVDFDTGLNTAIKRLREVLGDSAERPVFIETLPRRGYRFIAPVTFPGRQPAVSLSQLRALLLGGLVAVAALGLYYSWRQIGRRSQPTLRILTANPPENPVVAVVISRDGKYLAFSDDTGISLKIIDTGEIRSLPETKGLVAIDWFPQADKLLALRDYKELWAISMLGGPARKLYDCVSGAYVASVSPDGSQIAFLTQGVPSREIWMIGSNGEDPHRVVVADEFDRFMDFSWAPGGKRFAYIRSHIDPDKTHLYLETREITGNRPTLIFSDPRLTGTGETALCWLADRRIIFGLYALSHGLDQLTPTNLWAIRTDPVTGKISGTARRITDLPGIDIESLSASGDGKRLALLAERLSSPIYVGTLAASGKALKAPRRLTLDNWPNTPSAWTPRGRAILFFSERDGKIGIYRQATDQQTAEELFVGPGNYKWPEATPDGKWLLYWSELPTQPVNRLMRMPTTGGPSELVLTTAADAGYHCASRAQTCVLSEGGKDERGQRQFLFSEFDPVKGKTGLLTRFDVKGHLLSDFSLSPNGTEVALTDLTNQILLLRLSDGEIRRISVQHWDKLQGVAWSADGNSLFVSVFAPGSWNNTLLHVDLNGSATVLLQGRHVWLGHPAASPDGNYLAFTQDTGESNGAMLENF